MSSMLIGALTGRRVAALVLCPAVMAGLGGCGRTVDGSPVAGSGSRLDAILATKPLSELLVDRSLWPSDYPAASGDAHEALGTIDGVPPGSHVEPADCQPPVPNEIVAMEGRRADDTALRLVLARGVGRLSARRDQVARCTSFAVNDSTGSWTVGANMLPPPIAGADDAFAVDLTQDGDGQHRAVVLVGQVGDVRVMAQAVGSGDEQVDTTGLDEIFTAQVLTLRHTG
ncbi:MAG: hypothetical protein JO191_10985 [Mycobacteriaceae bacterium]|nr:hypothetical protein [Mycobacteriaceae bacterium]